MKKQVVANLKMNMTSSEIKNYIISLAPKYKDDKVELTLALPYVSLELGRFMLDGTTFALGAQNLSDEERGAQTGEISGAMLKDIGAQKVIVGHIERRVKFKENGKTINKKIKIALKNRLQVVLCVGESLTDKNSLKTISTIASQVDEALKGLYENELENIIIAYEPVWAIGSGKNATVKEIETGIKAIRKAVENDFSKKAAEEIGVIYGGSVNAKNISQISSCRGLDGVLVGEACLDSGVLMHIMTAFAGGAKK